MITPIEPRTNGVLVSQRLRQNMVGKHEFPPGMTTCVQTIEKTRKRDMTGNEENAKIGGDHAGGVGRRDVNVERERSFSRKIGRAHV